MRERFIDAKIEKWKKRPLRNLTTEQLAELVADLREETKAIEETRKAIQLERDRRIHDGE